MHKVKAKGILSASNGINIYRGCLHGCIYCDSRSDCYQMKHKFEDIEVKENAPELLEKTLSSKRKPCMIGTGAMSDPYIPLEKDLRIMRKCLEIIEKYSFGVTVHTKSSSVMRDIDILEKINRKSKAVLQMTLTTADENLCKIIEPNVSSTAERVRTLNEFHNANIPTVVWLSPFLPFINDTQENIDALLDYCIKAGVKGIICFKIGVTLRNGDREYFYSQLDRFFPGMKERYMRTYGNSYEVLSPNSDYLMKRIENVCQNEGIMFGIDRVFSYLRKYENKYENQNIQLSLFDNL
ncbi:radical SAM protein [uncultured Ruminococcus sp.]|uniref:SPL family radical SAM protein n=1 Tax=uncultured Ruminococcus sp. TaxID=165186 RepID=UPI00266ECB57|nr:radical SAM protein [uncultured Ruminococcus sp.]